MLQPLQGACILPHREPQRWKEALESLKHGNQKKTSLVFNTAIDRFTCTGSARTCVFRLIAMGGGSNKFGFLLVAIKCRKHKRKWRQDCTINIHFGSKEHRVNDEQLPTNISNINAISNHKLPIANQFSFVQYVFSACVHIAYNQSGIPNLERWRSKHLRGVGWLATSSYSKNHKILLKIQVGGSSTSRHILRHHPLWTLPI